MRILKRLAFRMLFPRFVDATKEKPTPGHAVFVLDCDQSTKFVHVAKYDVENDCYDSDDGWFEADEIEYWCYVPDILNEMMRREPAVNNKHDTQDSETNKYNQRTKMFIRNDYTMARFEVKSKDEIRALHKNQIPAFVLWIFQCAWESMDYLNPEGASDDLDRKSAVAAAEIQLKSHTELIELSVVCDDSNNPPDVLAKGQTILTVNVLLGAGLGEYHYSFSTKEL